MSLKNALVMLAALTALALAAGCGSSTTDPTAIQISPTPPAGPGTPIDKVPVPVIEIGDDTP